MIMVFELMYHGPLLSKLVIWSKILEVQCLQFPDLPDSCPMAMMNRQILPYLARAVRFCLGIHLRDPEIRFEI